MNLEKRKSGAIFGRLKTWVSSASDRTRLRVRSAAAGSLLLIIASLGLWMMAMPGSTFDGPLPPLTMQEQDISTKLQAHIDVLATKIGPRNTIDNEGAGLQHARDYIERVWTSQGLEVKRHTFVTNSDHRVSNLEVEVAGLGLSEEIFVVGAHYDTHLGSPGAADNASGVAVMLELSRILKRHPMAQTVRFVAFTNEEMPFSRGIDMGSLVYAHRSRSRQEKIVAMWSLETIANFTDAPDTQRYPAHLLSLFYPTTGNFVTFLGNMSSRSDVTLPVKTFRRLVDFPSEGLLAPPWFAGTHRSDHWSFWMMDYPGIMVTDTAPFRYGDYHLPSDTAEKLEYDHMARVTLGLARVIDVVVNGEAALGL